MDKIKTREDIDHAIESTAGVVLDIDTVAIWDLEKRIYGIYIETGNWMWELQMTCSNLAFLKH